MAGRARDSRARAARGAALAALAAPLVGVLVLPGCSGPKACLRPGYDFEIREPDGSPAPKARVTFEAVERDAEGKVLRPVGRAVTLAADEGGRVVVGPLRGRFPKPARGLERGTRVVVAMPDGRRLETFHRIRPRVRCRILPAEPMLLGPVGEPSPADEGD